MKKGLKILLVLMLFLYFPKVKAITITTDPSMTYGSGYQLVTNTGEFRVYIEGVGEYDNSQFAAYKIIDVYYNKSTDSLKYKFTANFQNFLNSSSTYNSVTIDSFFNMFLGSSVYFSDKYNNITSDNVIAGGYYESHEFGRIMSAYATYIRTNLLNRSGVELGSSGKLTSAPLSPYRHTSLAVGTYLILPTSADFVYSVMVDSIQLKKKNNEWVIDTGNVVSKKSEASIHNTLTQGSESSSDISVKCGDFIQGKVAVSLPLYPADSSNRRVEIVLGKYSKFSSITADTYKISGMDIVKENTTWVLKKNSQKVGTLAYTSGKVRIFLDDIRGLGNNLEITYPVEPLDASTAILGNKGNSREVSLIMRDPYVGSSENGDATINYNFKIFTYALQITGTTGARFTVTKNGNSIGTVSIGSNGLGELKGIQAGTYTIEQTTAPPGYTKLPESKTLKVGNGGTEVSGKDGYYNITMTNNILAILPYTGSKGTIIFTIAGVLLTLLSIIILIIYKKKKQKNEIEII